MFRSVKLTKSIVNVIIALSFSQSFLGYFTWLFTQVLFAHARHYSLFHSGRLTIFVLACIYVHTFVMANRCRLTVCYKLRILSSTVPRNINDRFYGVQNSIKLNNGSVLQLDVLYYINLALQVLSRHAEILNTVLYILNSNMTFT